MHLYRLGLMAVCHRLTELHRRVGVAGLRLAVITLPVEVVVLVEEELEVELVEQQPQLVKVTLVAQALVVLEVAAAAQEVQEAQV